MLLNRVGFKPRNDTFGFTGIVDYCNDNTFNAVVAMNFTIEPRGRSKQSETHHRTVTPRIAGTSPGISVSRNSKCAAKV